MGLWCVCVCVVKLQTSHCKVTIGQNLMNHRRNLFPTGNHVIDTLSVAPSCDSLPHNNKVGNEINSDVFIAILL